MSTVINGSSPSITFSDGTTQSTAANISSPYTANGVVYASSTSALATGSGITYNGTTFSTTNDASIHGLTVGQGAGSVSTNTAVGASALAGNTTGATSVAVGNLAAQTNSTGANITAVGYKALNLTTTDNNTAVGMQAGRDTSSGTNNVFMGKNSAVLNSTGGSLVAIGVDALFNNTTASNNTAVGYQAGYNATGSANTFVGQNAGSAVTSGTNNTILGASGAQTLTTGSYNLSLGYATRFSSSSISSAIIIGSGNLENNDKGSSTGYINPNGGGMYQGNNSAAWSVTSDQRLKKNIVDNNVGLSAITAIQVRNFEYRTEDEVTDLPKHSAIAKQGVQLGVIAQELQQVLPDCVKQESTGVLAVDSTDIMYHMINAIKELNAKITALEAKLGA